MVSSRATFRMRAASARTCDVEGRERGMARSIAPRRSSCSAGDVDRALFSCAATYSDAPDGEWWAPVASLGAWPAGVDLPVVWLRAACTSDGRFDRPGGRNGHLRPRSAPVSASGDKIACDRTEHEEQVPRATPWGRGSSRDRGATVARPAGRGRHWPDRPGGPCGSRSAGRARRRVPKSDPRRPCRPGAPRRIGCRAVRRRRPRRRGGGTAPR